ncbi:hypothetical protein [Geomonas sp. Red276]
MNRLRGGVTIQPILVTMTRLYTPGTFLGNIGKDTFWIQKWEKGFNSFFPLFRGTFVQTSDGTRIIGKFTLHPVTRVFMGGFMLASALLTAPCVRIVVASEGPFGFGFVTM